MREEDAQELEQYRAKFRHVDTSDPDSLKRWLIEHRHLNIGALAAITQVPRPRIRAWRKAAGLAVCRGQYNTVKNKPIDADLPVDPPLPGQRWSSYEWLSAAYERTRSTSKIARAVGVSHKRVEQRLMQLGLYRPKPPHPCNNREWLNLHYVQQARSVAECARMAGVNRHTMLNWLANHDIVVHTKRQNSYAILRGRPVQTPLWFKELAGMLGELPEVRYVSLQELGMKVRYADGTLEMYWTTPLINTVKRMGRTYVLDQASGKYRRDVPVHRQYPGDGFQQSPYNHFIINRSDWEAATLIERRVAMHRFILANREAFRETYLYPDELIDECLGRFRAGDYGRFCKDGILLLHDRWVASRVWVLSFSYFELGWGMDRLWHRPRWATRVMNALFKRRNLPLSTESALRLACRNSGVKLINPLGYRAVFEALGLKRGGTVLDLEPDAGSKALACALVGGTYLTAGDAYFRRGAERGFAERVGLNWSEHDGREPVDLVFADNMFREFDPGPVLERYSGVARRIACYVPAALRREYETLYRPRAVLGVRHKCHRKDTDNIFVW